MLSEILRWWCQPEARIPHTAIKSATAIMKRVEGIGKDKGCFYHQNEWFLGAFA
jgi:hypothetical protein